MIDDATTVPAPPRLSVTMSARDLLNVAIFAVIYFVIVFAIAMLGIINPLVMLLSLPLSIIVAGIPFVLFLTRVRHAGMVTLFGTVVALLYLISGHPWISTLLTIAVSLGAEAVLWAGRYRSRWSTIGAYAVFSVWYLGPMLPLLMNRSEYLNSPGMQAMGPEYVAAFDETVTVTALWIYTASALVSGLIGGLVGAFLLKKHFTRAGLA
jgi:energy-coupling factor transport system substrate-specific component